MTPKDLPQEFERDMGCTPAELVASLRRALPGAALAVDASRCVASAAFDDGVLHLEWREAPARQIALLSIPRILVRFRFERMTPERRHEVQRRFDMVYQRGGG